MISNTKLTQFRQEIDEVDHKILKSLAKRAALVKKIGIYKKEKGIQPLDINRWKQVIKNRRKIADKIGLSPDFVEKIWHLLHNEALKIED